MMIAAIAAKTGGGAANSRDRKAAAMMTAVTIRALSILDLAQASKTAVASGEIKQRLLQVFSREVWPEHVGKVQLGIGQLPQEKVGETTFAAGPDQQVRRRGIAQSQSAVHAVLGDRLWRQTLVADRFGQSAGGRDDIGPTTVVHSHVQDQSLVVLGSLFCPAHAVAQGRI